MTRGLSVQYCRRRHNKIEQRETVIKFHAKCGTSATKPLEMMKEVYGDDFL